MEKILFKNKRCIICYIEKDGKGYHVCTGKPSDTCHLAWDYDNIDDARRTAQEILENHMNFVENILRCV